MERLPDEPLGGAPFTPEQTRSLARTLRQLYEVPLASIRTAQIKERPYGPSTLPVTLSEWLNESYDLSDCRDRDLVSTAVDAALEWLGSSGNLPEPHLHVLGISDLNPANVLWDGERCRLVDFEDGGLSDPAYELTDHTEHLAGRLCDVFDRDALVDAVDLSQDGRDRMAAYRPLWAAFWLTMLLPGNGGFRRNPPGTTEAQATHLLALLG
jgi:hypothetical protein